MKRLLPDWVQRSRCNNELLTLWVIALAMPPLMLWDAYGGSSTIRVPEAWIASLFCGASLPIVTTLVWWMDRLDQLEARRPPSELAESRRVGRIVACVFAIGVGLTCVFFLTGTLQGGIPIRYLGHVLIGVGFLGLAGVNVFIGGPLDRRLDEK